MNYISLDSVVNDYINESEQSNAKYFKLWHIAFRGLEDLGLDFFYQVKTVKLPVNSNLTVNLPPDYLNWTKVGVLNSVGEIIPLYYNDKLTTFADLSSDRLTNTQDNTLFDWNTWGLNTWCNYWDGYGYTTYYGVPSGAPFVGGFKIDSDNSVIVLDQTFRYEYLMVEYVSSPKEGNEYYLPVQFREALISWVRWKDIISTPSKTHVQNSNTTSRERNYWRDRRNAIAKYKPIRQSEKYQASQEQTRLAVKS